MDIVDDVTVQWFIAGSCIFGVITALSIYVCMARRYKKNFWHHGVRLPSQPEKTFWYLVTMSIGCRPFGGHEGDVYMRLIGSRGESNTFLFNAEIHSRLHEAGCQMYLYASAWPLGEINYIIVACGAAERKKRWFLSSVHVKHLSEDKSKENVWYFPYHEWIEVFLDPVKVTLCVVDPEHDLNRRLLLGWLARGVSDFHLWLSMFGPLKYTRFRRSERWACVGSHFVTSIVSCILFNWFISDMGAFVLGVYASAGAAVPIYLCEWLLRQTERHPKIVIEDLLWYKGSGKCNYTPIAYNQYMLPASNDCDISTITCPKCEEDDEQRLQDFEDYHGILRNDRVFWKWLTKGSGITLTPSTTLVSTLSNMDSFFTGSDASRYLEPQGPIEEDKVSQFVETQAIKEDESRSQWSQRSQRSQSSQRSQNSQFYDTPGVQDDDEVSEYFDIEDVESQKEKKKRKPLFSKKIANKFFGKMKGAARFVKNKAENLVKGGNDLVKRTLLRGRDDEDLDREGALASDAEDEISYNSQLQESLHESIIEATNLDEINILEGEMLDFPEDWLNYIKLGPPFVVDPTTVWNVDSQYSISSLGMDGMNFGNFVLLESMPVADFDLLRHGKRPLLHPGGDTNFDDIFRHRTLVGKVSEIKLPPNAENLSLEEGQLISMVYFDLITNSKQWVKPGYPDQAYITPDGDSYVRPATDWMKLDISSKKDFEDWNTIDFRGELSAVSL
ncbi:unnamed protein product [Clavelina lepadiformis]|uniref:PLAT domain-containing protein n=1 Tax=Clavelina lepadiformis TaxID=159417 RepID=A0ABP0FZI4_CLALP